MVYTRSGFLFDRVVISAGHSTVITDCRSETIAGAREDDGLDKNEQSFSRMFRVVELVKYRHVESLELRWGLSLLFWRYSYLKLG